MMNFGQALEQLKQGKRVARKGWNGKGIFLELNAKIVKPDLEYIAELVHNSWWEQKLKSGITDHPDMIPYNELSENVKEYDRVTARTVINILNEQTQMTHPYIFIDTTGLQTDNQDAPKNRVPWLASQTDMLSEDWEVFE